MHFHNLCLATSIIILSSDSQVSRVNWSETDMACDDDCYAMRIISKNIIKSKVKKVHHSLSDVMSVTPVGIFSHIPPPADKN